MNVIRWKTFIILNMKIITRNKFIQFEFRGFYIFVWFDTTPGPTYNSHTFDHFSSNTTNVENILFISIFYIVPPLSGMKQQNAHSKVKKIPNTKKKKENSYTHRMKNS